MDATIKQGNLDASPTGIQTVWFTAPKGGIVIALVFEPIPWVFARVWSVSPCRNLDGCVVFFLSPEHCFTPAPQIWSPSPNIWKDLMTPTLVEIGGDNRPCPRTVWQGLTANHQNICRRNGVDILQGATSGYADNTVCGHFGSRMKQNKLNDQWRTHER